jgi:hypothetical protein
MALFPDFFVRLKLGKNSSVTDRHYLIMISTGPFEELVQVPDDSI